MAGEGVRPQKLGNAVNLRNCRKNGKRGLFDAETHASNIIALRFKNSFARSSPARRNPCVGAGGFTVGDMRNSINVLLLAVLCTP